MRLVETTMRKFIDALLSSLLTLACGLAYAEDPMDTLPKVDRDASIQSPQQFFGFDIGSRHLRHDQVVDYLTYLTDVSPRIKSIPYGTTHGQRTLMVAAFSAPENLERLEQIRAGRRRLTSGKYRGELAEELLVMYVGYSVHGDEASAINAAPVVAYHLASAQSEEVTQWLSQGIFLIDPALNPDGVDRFANWANDNRGKLPSPNSLDREHVQPWPGGRTNYYWFDLNRDWLPLVHPESQGRLRLFHSWKPNVVLDFHEMSGNSSFFFQPGIPERNNPLSQVRNLELTRKFAAEHARSMDAAGELYFTEERFDDFYVGKGSTYPDLHGAVGILFEQGSTRGLRLTNNRTDRHFRDTVANQVRTSLSSLRVANASREELLDYQTTFYQQALESALGAPVTAYVLAGSPSRIAAAGKLLQSHAIEVYQPDSIIRVLGQEHTPASVVIIPCNQPEYTFVKSLMEPLENFRENIFYDVSAWHLPSAFDLEMLRIDHDVPGNWLAHRFSPTPRTGVENNPQANGVENTDVKLAVNTPVGFAFSPLELDVPKLVATLHKAGTQLRVTTEPMTTGVGDQRIEWPIGTFLVLKQANAKNWSRLTQIIDHARSTHQVSVSPIESGITASGPDLGSDSTLDIPRCNPLLVVGSGTQSYSAGALWHYLDVRVGQASTRVDADRIRSLDLHDYTCVILPEGSYSDWSTADAEHLSRYVQGGGTVIAVASAIKRLSSLGLIELDSAASQVSDNAMMDLTFGEARDAAALESIAGAFFRARIDATHPLAYGFPDTDVPVFRDHELSFSAPKNGFKLAATYGEVLAGYVSAKNRERLRNTAAVWAEPSGSGRYILLADNPVFRGYVRASERFLSNAMLLGPALQIPSASFEESNAAEEHSH